LTAQQQAKTTRVRSPPRCLMGSTYVDFQGQGFKARDATLEISLPLLVDEIDRLENPP
jgi:hypothetical protein